MEEQVVFILWLKNRARDWRELATMLREHAAAAQGTLAEEKLLQSAHEWDACAHELEEEVHRLMNRSVIATQAAP